MDTLTRFVKKIELANLSKQGESWLNSESLFQDALKHGCQVMSQLHLELGDSQFHQKKYQSAITSYRAAWELDSHNKEAYRQLVKAFDRDQLVNLRAYFVNHSKKIVYCRIPKNACTIFTNMMLETSSIADEFRASDWGPHDFLSHNRAALRLEDLCTLNDSSYYKFVVLRHPLKRLVSGYLDKFAKTTQFEKMAKHVIEAVHQESGKEVSLEKSITFEEFILYLLRTDDHMLDVHWRPQNTFFNDSLFEFDFVGNFEDLNSTIQQLERTFDTKVSTRIMDKASRGHKTQYSRVKNIENAHTLSPENLRKLGGFPRPEQLFTPKLLEAIEDRYSKDIETYKKYFDFEEIVNSSSTR